MKPYAIDLDILKMILGCRSVQQAQWRVSASKKGFHFFWYCEKKRCKICSAIERYFDDPSRQKRDRLRKTHQRKVLWDKKGRKKAGPWTKVIRGKSASG